MIDIHSHLLPLVDDGSESVETSLALLKYAEGTGVTDIILTPHFKTPYKKTPQELKEIFLEFNKRKDLENINVNLYLGNEVHYSKNTRKTLRENGALSLNGTNYVLIEFDYFNQTDVTEAVYGLIRDGYTPIVAHVERYSYVTLNDIIEIKEMGGLIQINASSLVGEVKGRTKKLIKKLFKLSLVDFVSSDAHANRKNYLALSYAYVLKKYGKEVANKVFVDNAKKIIGQA